MSCDKKELLLYAVTDRSWLNGRTLYEQVEDALKGGATFIQLREKKLDIDSFRKEAAEIKELCARYHVPFVINDNVMELAGSGICGIAVVSAIFASENIIKATQKLKELTIKMTTQAPDKFLTKSSSHMSSSSETTPNTSHPENVTCISEDGASSKDGVSC